MEMACHHAIGWATPVHVVDLYAEFRVLTNDIWLPHGSGLLGALAYFGREDGRVAEKAVNRALALRGEPYTPAEWKQLVAYCREDVNDAEWLFSRVSIDEPRSLVRGRSTKALASYWQRGVPLDRRAYDGVIHYRAEILHEAVLAANKTFCVFDKRDILKQDLLEAEAKRLGIPWPRTSSGRLAQDADTLAELAAVYPEVEALAEEMKDRAQLKRPNITMAADGRNRVDLHPFGTDTGRSRHKNDFLFVNSSWLHHLAKPPRGYGLASSDFVREEIGIAAIQANDAAMLAAYESAEDLYIAAARQFGLVRDCAGAAEIKAARARAKTVMLASGYRSGAETLAARLRCTIVEAEDALARHRQTYHAFWKHADAVIEHAASTETLSTPMGWRITLRGNDLRPAKLQNWPIQATGADILLIAVSLAVERGVEVCATVHDSIIYQGEAREMRDVVATVEQAMCEASAACLGGYELRVESKVFAYPRRYQPDKGRALWHKALRVLRRHGIEIEE
jgi:hypothetical protein